MVPSVTSVRSSCAVTNVSVSLLLLGVILFTGGCQSTYSPSDLPTRYIAPAPRDSARINLARLARKVTPSESLYPGDQVDVTIVTGAEEGPPVRPPLGRDVLARMDRSSFHSSGGFKLRAFSVTRQNTESVKRECDVVCTAIRLFRFRSPNEKRTA